MITEIKIQAIEIQTETTALGQLVKNYFKNSSGVIFNVIEASAEDNSPLLQKNDKLFIVIKEKKEKLLKLIQKQKGNDIKALTSIGTIQPSRMTGNNTVSFSIQKEANSSTLSSSSNSGNQIGTVVSLNKDFVFSINFSNPLIFKIEKTFILKPSQATLDSQIKAIDIEMYARLAKMMNT